jgi:hypothetical protein
MKLIYCLLLSLLSLQASAQLSEKSVHVYGKYSLGKVDSATYHSFGITTEIFVHKYIGINYNFDFTNRNDNIRHFHTSMGLLGGPILIGVGLTKMVDGDSTTHGGLAIVGLLLLALPDGVSFHLPVSYNMDVSAYANVIGLDFIKNRKTSEKWIKYACSFGVKTTYTVRDHLTLTGFVETRQAAKFGWSFGGGVGIGYVFD